MKKDNTELASVVVSNNIFTGVHWDAKAIEAVNNVSKALLNLTELFRSQHINIDTMLNIDANGTKNSSIS